MSFIAEFEISTTILQEAMSRVPEMTFETEDLRSLPGGEWIYVFWAAGEDFETFSSALSADPTVERFTELAELEQRRLYRVTLSREGGKSVTTPTAAKHDIFFLNVQADHDTMRVRARVPTRDALLTYREECVERDMVFRLYRLYGEEQGRDGDAGEYGLTPTQRETLQTALEAGYFEVPRRTSQTDLAEELGLSDQALSTRLRRGIETLVTNTVGPPGT